MKYYHLIVMIVVLALVIVLVKLKTISEANIANSKSYSLAKIELAAVKMKMDKFAFWQLNQIKGEIESGSKDIDGMGYRIISIADFMIDVKTDEMDHQICRQAFTKIFEIIEGKAEYKRLGYIIVNNVWLFRGDEVLAQKYNLNNEKQN